MSSFVLNDLEKLSTAELHALSQQYPYFAGVKTVLAKRENSPQHLQQASWLSADRTALKQYLEQTPATENRQTAEPKALTPEVAAEIKAIEEIQEVQPAVLPEPVVEEAVVAPVTEAAPQEATIPAVEFEEPVVQAKAVETPEVAMPVAEAAEELEIDVFEEPAQQQAEPEVFEAPVVEPEVVVVPEPEQQPEEQEEEEAETEINTNQNLSFDDWLKNFSIGADKKVVVKKEPQQTAQPTQVDVEKRDEQELNNLIASSVPYELESKAMKQEPQYAKGVSDFINSQKSKQRNRIQQSIAFDGESPITETYAKLLVGQKKYERAIEVYERLILKFPAKSTYFAAQIEKLKTI